MKYGVLVALGLAAILATTLFAQSPAKSDGSNCGKALQVSATVYGSFTPSYEGGPPAWYGNVLVRFGNQPVKVAAFVDRNNSPTGPVVRPNGTIYGTETISLTFVDGSFDIVARFEGVPENTPGLFQLHEVGTIANGKGAYEGVSGSVTIRGPFVHPMMAVDAPLWIAQMRGVLFGLKAP